MFWKRKKPVQEISPEQVHNYMLDVFSTAENEVLCAPFNDNKVWIKLKRLSEIDIKGCGEFSLIETAQDWVNQQHKKELTMHQMSEYSELQHNIVKAALVSPTYDQILEVIMKDLDYDEKEVKERMQNIKELFYTLFDSSDVNDRKKATDLQNEFAVLELRYNFRLPADFIGFVMNHALSIDVSDIKKVTDEILYNAFIAGKLATDAPADHVDGRFTKFNKSDINNRAWIIGAEKERERREKQSTKRK